MHLKTRNVNTAFTDLVYMFRDGERALGHDITQVPIIKCQSRNGPVMRIDEPVIISYTRPKERVLFNPARDANPFFHLYEALWMLAGRNDVDSVAYYAKQMREYSDDGETLNGAYGYRWRNAAIPYNLISGAFNKAMNDIDGHNELVRQEKADPKMFDGKYGTDQLDVLVDHLKADPNSRRAVLQMWNVEDDLLKIGPGKMEEYEDYSECPEGITKNRIVGVSKDVCCNLSVIFSIRDNREIQDSGGTQPWGDPIDIVVRNKELDMTVVSRSEDLIWGLLGADYVDFTILQEYMAARLGCEVGLYHHMVNNLHVYESNWKPNEWLSKEPHSTEMGTYGYTCPVSGMKTIDLINDTVKFERELPLLVETFGGDNPERKTYTDYSEPFFLEVAGPMFSAFAVHKSHKDTNRAIDLCDQIVSDDWRISCKEWLKRRCK